MISINDQLIAIKHFPDNTLMLNYLVTSPIATIKWLYQKDEEMALYFLVNHLRDNGVKKITLDMPYIPNARMDRVKNEDEVFTLKYFAKFINDLYFDQVIVKDPHSDVSVALINNLMVDPVNKIITDLATNLLKGSNDIIFYPDKGSYLRYSKVIKHKALFGTKHRDWKTGLITDYNISDIPDVPFDVLIVDDISSYGTTFFYAAKKLKEIGANKIYLYITHCENSILEGKLIGSGLIDKIYTTQSIFNQSHPLIEVIGETKDEL